jgi:BON domain-containing protein
MMAGLKRISATLGALAAIGASATSAMAQSPASPNQNTANAVAAALGTSPALSGYRIEIETREGQVALRGAVNTPAQHAEAIRLAREVPGVVSVVDWVKVVGDPRVRPAQYQMAMGHRGGMVDGGYVDGGMVDGGMVNGGMVNGGMINSTVGQPGMDGPMPEAPAGVAGGVQAAMPGYPNYAWPSYAPYPNFSAVGYPTVYPWQAWPNIGPVYPYPEVPLDWRAVTLRWDDGIWWLDFKSHYTRPFFTPYPFGIFSY